MTNRESASAVLEKVDTLIHKLADPDIYGSMNYSDRRGLSVDLNEIRHDLDNVVAKMAEAGLPVDDDDAPSMADRDAAHGRPAEPEWRLEMENTKSGRINSWVFTDIERARKHIADAMYDGGWNLVSFERVN